MAKTDIHASTDQHNLKSRTDDSHKLHNWGNRWSLRLHKLNGSVKPATSYREWSAREYVTWAGKQLVNIGEVEGNSAAMLMASLCNALRIMIGRPETKESRKALRIATNAISKVIPADVASSERLLTVPEPKERSQAALVWRDNIARCLVARNDLDALTTAVTTTLSVAVCNPDFFGSRFLINKAKSDLSSRQSQWAKETLRVLSRADLSTSEGRDRAATRIVKQCAQADGMTPTQAKNLFRFDRIPLSGKQQVKKVRSRG